MSSYNDENAINKNLKRHPMESPFSMASPATRKQIQPKRFNQNSSPFSHRNADPNLDETDFEISSFLGRPADRSIADETLVKQEEYDSNTSKNNIDCNESTILREHEITGLANTSKEDKSLLNFTLTNDSKDNGTIDSQNTSVNNVFEDIKDVKNLELNCSPSPIKFNDDESIILEERELSNILNTSKTVDNNCDPELKSQNISNELIKEASLSESDNTVGMNSEHSTDSASNGNVPDMNPPSNVDEVEMNNDEILEVDQPEAVKDDERDSLVSPTMKMNDLSVVEEEEEESAKSNISTIETCSMTTTTKVGLDLNETPKASPLRAADPNITLQVLPPTINESLCDFLLNEKQVGFEEELENLQTKLNDVYKLLESRDEQIKQINDSRKAEDDMWMSQLDSLKAKLKQAHKNEKESMDLCQNLQEQIEKMTSMMESEHQIRLKLEESKEEALGKANLEMEELKNLLSIFESEKVLMQQKITELEQAQNESPKNTDIATEFDELQKKLKDLEERNNHLEEESKAASEFHATSLESEIAKRSEIEQKLFDVEKMHSDLLMKFSEMEDQLNRKDSEIKQNVDEASKLNEELNSKISEMNSTCAKYLEENARLNLVEEKLNETIAHLEKENCISKEQSEALATEIEQLKASIECLKSENNQLKDEISKSNESSNQQAVSEELNQAMAQIESLKNENETLEKIVEELNQSIREVNADSAKIEAEKVEQENELKTLKLKIEEYESQANQIDHTKIDFEQKIEELKVKATSSETSLEEVRKEKEDVEILYNTIKDEMIVLEEKFSQERLEQEAKNAELEDVRKSFETMKKTYEDTIKLEKDSHVEEVEKLNSTIETLEKSIEQLKEENVAVVENLQSSLRDTESKLADLMEKCAQVDELKQNAESLGKQILDQSEIINKITLERDNALSELSSSRNDFELEKEKLMMTIADVEAKLNALEAEKEKVVEGSENAVKMVSNYEEEISRLKQLNETSDGMILDIRKELDTCKADLILKSDRLMELESELQQLNESLMSEKNQAEKLKDSIENDTNLESCSNPTLIQIKTMVSDKVQGFVNEQNDFKATIMDLEQAAVKDWKKIDELQISLNQTTTNLEQRSQENNELRAENERLRLGSGETEMIRRKCEELESKTNDLEEKLAGKVSEYEQLKFEKQQLLKTVENVEKEKSDTERVINELKSDVNKLVIERTSLEKELEMVKHNSSNMQSLMEVINQMKDQLNSMSAQLESARQNEEQAQQDVTIMKEEVCEKEVMMEEQAKCIEELKKKLEETEEHLRIEKERLSKCALESAEYQKKIEDLEKNLLESEQLLRNEREKPKLNVSQASSSQIDENIVEDLKKKLAETEECLQREQRKAKNLEEVCDKFDDEESEYLNKIEKLEKEITLLKGIKPSPKKPGLIELAKKNLSQISHDESTLVEKEEEKFEDAISSPSPRKEATEAESKRVDRTILIAKGETDEPMTPSKADRSRCAQQ